MSLPEIRQFLTDRRVAIARLFAQGVPGPHVGSALGDMIDQTVTKLYLNALAPLTEKNREIVEKGMALVALGGFGRQDLAPYSDVDLLFLYKNSAKAVAIPVAKQVVRDVWDVGLNLGQTVATIGETLDLASREILSGTALLEARHLLGPEELFQVLEDRFRRRLRWGLGRKMYGMAIEAIQEEHEKFGLTTQLLEPDVKKSAGGLRDLHLIRWLGSAILETANFESLEERGALEYGESRILNAAHDFLLRVRIELHFHAKRAVDTLSRGEQLRISKAWGYKDSSSLLAVEQFMRDYFRHATAISEIAYRFVGRLKPGNWFAPIADRLFGKRLAPGVIIGRRGLVLDEHARKLFATDLEKTLQVAIWAAEADVEVDRKTRDLMRLTFAAPIQLTFAPGEDPAKAPPVAPLDPLPPAVVKKFLNILGGACSQSRAVRFLHEVGALERIIPEFEHARCLLQFNAYHKYTVDEHTLVMLEHGEKLQSGSDLVGRAFQKVARKDLLFLAILLHDLGKGFEQDHSELGAVFADRCATRFQLSDEDRQTLVFLVRQHLLLSGLAYHRDIQDRKLQVTLTRDVGSAQTLRMLYALTVVDNMAVGPGTYTKWKADLLAELYVAALRLFGENEEFEAARQRAKETRRKLLDGHDHDERTRRHVEALPADYLAEVSVEQALTHLERWKTLAKDDIAVLSDYRPGTGAITFTVLTDEKITDGLFSKICGALSSHRLEILAARIHTLADDAVLDQFDVVDVHFPGEPASDRMSVIAETIRQVVKGEIKLQDIIWSNKASSFLEKPRILGREFTRIEIDNTNSDAFTVIDVFTSNRQGLLYTVTRAISRLGLSVQFAKIATYEDEVMDVFYVQRRDGNKVRREEEVRQIREQLRREIQQLSEDPRSLGA